ncbi:MAG: FHIPEP family type III secretion protein [Salinarimonas sp.]
MSLLNRLLAEMAKRQDLVFAFFFVLIVAMLVFPLPTWLVDALLAVNLTLSLIVLISATYLKHPLEMSSFPSIILLTSMLRVAMSVATTRLILATGDAGQLIVAFGQFVISGNLVVGLVIFLIIATVQFMVVTKGAERISEVSARFTLDALPGKQMSIDTDARNGDITPEEAREKRKTLQLEMQFYGAMDGAMRFVKGDAIAGLIIVFINLVGGMTIGMMQRGLTAAEAGQLYVLLSVGDGLIAQIPAMFIALAAGTIVTRVTTSTDSNLGRDITKQIGGDPKALGVSGVVAVAMGFTPGFPTIVFMILGSALCFVAWRMSKGPTVAKPPPAASKADGPDATGAPPPGQPGHGGQPPAPTGPDGQEPLPLRPAQHGDIMVISGNPETLELLRPDEIYAHVEHTKERFIRRMGFSAPPVGFRYDDTLDIGEFVVEIDEVPVRRFRIDDIDPARRMTTAQAKEYANHIAQIREKHAASLFGVPEAGQWLEEIQPICGRLATDIQQLMPFMSLVGMLRNLLDDGVGLTPPRLILEGLAHASQKAQNDPNAGAEVVRTFMSRQISAAAADRDGVIPAIVIGPDMDTRLRQAANPGPNANSATIEAADAAKKHFVELTREVAARHADRDKRPVFATAPDMRRFVRGLLKQGDVDIMVLSFADVAQGFSLSTIDVVTAEKQAA